MGKDERLVTPAGWTGDEERFAIRLKDIIEDIYRRLAGTKTHVTVSVDAEVSAGGVLPVQVRSIPGKSCVACWFTEDVMSASPPCVSVPYYCKAANMWVAMIHPADGLGMRVRGTVHFVFEKAPAVKQRGESE